MHQRSFWLQLALPRWPIEPALVEADRQRAGEERQEERERAEFVQEVRADLKRLPVIKPVEGKEVKR